MSIFGFKVEIGTINLLGIVSVLVLIIIGWSVRRGNWKHKRMIETLNTSAATFRNAFADEIAFLGETINEETIFKTNTFDVLTASREKHERAISVFKSTLGNGESSCLEKAWCKYQYPNGEPESAPCPFVDYISDGNKELEIKARKAALQNIANILKLAATK